MNTQEGSAQPCSVINSPVNDFVLVEKLKAKEHTGRVEPENKEHKEHEANQEELSSNQRSDADRACFSVKMLV